MRVVVSCWCTEIMKILHRACLSIGITELFRSTINIYLTHVQLYIPIREP